MIRVAGGSRWFPGIVIALGGLFVSVASADVEGELRAELVGRFALTKGALLSECTDSYTNVEVAGGRASGGRGARFEAGELARIDNVKAGAFSGLDLYLSFAVPYLLSFEDGPFTLYEEWRCRVQLEFQVEREVRRDRAKALASIATAVETFDNEEAAKRAGWNRRVTEPFPADWEQTKRRYQAWKIEERNRRVRAKSEEVLEVANQVLSSISDDEKYLASFGAGAKARSDSWSSCEAMLDASFKVSGSGDERDGWADGQKLAWATRLAHELQECYFPPE